MYQKPSVLKDKKLFVFDLDGTVYLGGKVFPEAAHFIASLREHGRRVLFFTNNASRSHAMYTERLTSLGLAQNESEIMTAGDVTLEFLTRKRAGVPVYLMGTTALWGDFHTAGIPLVNGADGRLTTDTVPGIVVTSYDRELTFDKLNLACGFLRNGAEYICTHPDYNCPIEGGYEPDSGSIAAAVTASTGISPKFLGKPSPEVAEMICAATGTDRDSICMIGDRLYTDIAAGRRGGITAVLTLTGEGTREDADALPDEDKPDIIAESLEEIEKAIF